MSFITVPISLFFSFFAYVFFLFLILFIYFIAFALAGPVSTNDAEAFTGRNM